MRPHGGLAGLTRDEVGSGRRGESCPEGPGPGYHQRTGVQAAISRLEWVGRGALQELAAAAAVAAGPHYESLLLRGQRPGRLQHVILLQQQSSSRWLRRAAAVVATTGTFLWRRESSRPPPARLQHPIPILPFRRHYRTHWIQRRGALRGLCLHHVVIVVLRDRPWLAGATSASASAPTPPAHRGGASANLAALGCPKWPMGPAPPGARQRCAKLPINVGQKKEAERGGHGRRSSQCRGDPGGNHPRRPTPLASAQLGGDLTQVPVSARARLKSVFHQWGCLCGIA